MPVFNNGKLEKNIVLVSLLLIFSNKNWLKLFLKTFVITQILPNFSTLEPYVENFRICAGFWDSMSHPEGQPSVKSMYVPNRVKKGIKDWR